MSRIGNKHIVLPQGVTVKVENNEVIVQGPKGTLKQEYDVKNITFKIENNTVIVSRANDNGEVKAKHGLYRALVANMVEGVTNGYSKVLEINGVGYKAQKSGNKLILNLGFSHPVEILEENGITIECPAANQIKISGIDKQKVGQFASNIRDIRPVEPYHAYGVKYQNEVVIRKVGKTAAKGKK